MKMKEIAITAFCMFFATSLIVQSIIREHMPKYVYSEEVNPSVEHIKMNGLTSCVLTYDSGSDVNNINDFKEEQADTITARELTNNAEESLSEVYVDLGLPSGTKWGKHNPMGYYTYDEAVNKFGNNLPSRKQWAELRDTCQWQWTGRGYKVTGPNGNTIILPAEGNCDCASVLDYNGIYGDYWTSESKGSSYAMFIDFDSTRVSGFYGGRCIGNSVRLIKN